MRRKITDSMKADILKAWQAGTDPLDIQIEFGIGQTSLEKIVKGVPSGRRPGKRRAFDYDEAWRLRARGFRAVEIAERMGVHENSIRRALRSIRKTDTARMEWKAAA